MFFRTDFSPALYIVKSKKKGLCSDEYRRSEPFSIVFLLNYNSARLLAPGLWINLRLPGLLLQDSGCLLRPANHQSGYSGGTAAVSHRVPSAESCYIIYVITYP